MASRTPARIAGHDSELGSIEEVEHADVLVLDRELAVGRVFVDGSELQILNP